MRVGTRVDEHRLPIYVLAEGVDSAAHCRSHGLPPSIACARRPPIPKARQRRDIRAVRAARCVVEYACRPDFGDLAAFGGRR